MDRKGSKDQSEYMTSKKYLIYHDDIEILSRMMGASKFNHKSLSVWLSTAQQRAELKIF